VSAVAAPLICIDCRYVRRRPSGIGEVTAQLAAHASGLWPEARFLFLKHPEAGRLSDAPNVEERVVPHAANGPVTMWALPRFVDLTGVALFHAPFNILPGGLSMPSVATVHDLMWLTHPGWAARPGWRGWVDRAFYRHGLRRALGRATRIACVSAATAAEVAAFAPAAAPRTRVTLSGVDAAFRPVPNPESGRRYILSVGQYAPYKNHDRVLEAFARIAEDVPDLDLLFVQRQGAGSAVLGPRAAALGVAERVRFVPSADREGLVRLYGGAAALAHPSLMEGFGNPLAEAMACGCPIVTSDRSAMPEVTGEAAMLVDPTDVEAIAAVLRRIVSDPALAADLREKGLARAAQLSWRAFAKANVAIYRELLT
jgi:glycosyltransferase involved in cell wall biosynthesis